MMRYLPFVFATLLLAACNGAGPPVTLTPAPDLGATVQAAVEKALPTATPTPTPTPTATPPPTPAATPTAVPTPTSQPTPTFAPSLTEDVEDLSVAPMVKRVRPAVVLIQTGRGHGTGFIFKTEGGSAFIATNAHVVGTQTTVTVTVRDTTRHNGTVLGRDATLDLAVVRISGGNFVTVPFGDADVLDPGDDVIAMGYPDAYTDSATITRGIVSAKRYDASRQAEVIQHDAPINPGNSGGPLLTVDGEVVGVNTFKRVEVEVEGIGFAISENPVQQRIPGLMEAPAPTPTTRPTAIPLTPRPWLTPTPRPTATPWPTVTPRPTRVPTATPRPEAQARHFGPLSGELRHDPWDDRFTWWMAGVEWKNFEVEATFTNPYAAPESWQDAHWSFGFIFRKSGAGDDERMYAVVVSSLSDGYVEVWGIWGGERGATFVGSIESLKTGAGEKNHLRLFVRRSQGVLYVNGESVLTGTFNSWFNINLQEAGNIGVFQGIREDTEREGAVTRFEGFQGRRLP